MNGFRSTLLLLLASWMPAVAQSASDLPKGIEVKSYNGWQESVYLNAKGRPIQVVMTPEVGGRIVRYSLGGENILFENAGSFGKNLGNSKGLLWIGGYQCDIGPESIELPDHNRIFVGPHRWRTDGDFAVTVYSSSNSLLRLQVEKELVLAPDTGDLGLLQRVRNISDQEIPCCIWDRTLCKGGGFAFFPLNSKSRFKAGWSMRRKAEGKSEYDGDGPFSMQVRILDGVLVAETVGEPTKLGADSDAGWIAYVHGDLLFVKYFPYFPHEHYSDGGNSVALYFDQRVAELEPISPQVALQPGKNYTFPEKWTLVRLEKPVTTPEQARALVKRIPPSPFKISVR